MNFNPDKIHEFELKLLKILKLEDKHVDEIKLIFSTSHLPLAEVTYHIESEKISEVIQLIEESINES